MNNNPHFRYYVALVLILVLVLLLRVQVQPVGTTEQVRQKASPTAYYAVGSRATR